MTKVYLAGPMSGIEKFNAPAFFSAERWLEEQDYTVFNPARNDVANGFDPYLANGNETKEELADRGFDLRVALGQDLAWIAAEADEIVVLPNWARSKGVAAELALAKALGLPINFLTKESEFWFWGDADLTAISFEVEESTDEADFIVHYDEENWYHDGSLAAEIDTSPKNAQGPVESLAPWSDEALQAKEMDGGAILTTSTTGGQKGSKEQRYDLIPVEPLRLLATLYGRGAEKYDDNNWRKGYDWKLSYASAQRHMNQFWGGEDIDPEMDLPHVIMGAWHMFTLAQFMIDFPQFDGRIKK
jgi:hypothetical protein